jgi:hypothetical protein
MPDTKPQTPEAIAAQAIAKDPAVHDDANTAGFERAILRANAAHYLPILKAACAVCEGPEVMDCRPCVIYGERIRLQKGLS